MKVNRYLVNRYLVNRILELERDLKRALNEKFGVSQCLEIQKNKIDELNEKLEKYQIEREHIKEIITCNIEESLNKVIYISDCERDFDALISILEIKPEDYDNKEVSDEVPED